MRTPPSGFCLGPCLHHKIRASGNAPAASTAGDLFHFQSPSVHVRSPPSSLEKRTEVVFTHSNRVAYAYVSQPSGLAQVVYCGCTHAQSPRHLANREVLPD